MSHGFGKMGLPTHETLMEALVDDDLVAFQTFLDCQNTEDSLEHLLGLIDHAGRGLDEARRLVKPILKQKRDEGREECLKAKRIADALAMAEAVDQTLQSIINISILFEGQEYMEVCGLNALEDIRLKLMTLFGAVFTNGATGQPHHEQPSKENDACPRCVQELAKAKGKAMPKRDAGRAGPGASSFSAGN